MLADNEVGFLLSEADAVGLVGVDSVGIDLFGLLRGFVKKIQAKLVVARRFDFKLGQQLVLLVVDGSALSAFHRDYIARCFTPELH